MSLPHNWKWLQCYSTVVLKNVFALFYRRLTSGGENSHFTFSSLISVLAPIRKRNRATVDRMYFFHSQRLLNSQKKFVLKFLFFCQRKNLFSSLVFFQPSHSSNKSWINKKPLFVCLALSTRNRITVLLFFFGGTHLKQHKFSASL